MAQAECPEDGFSSSASLQPVPKGQASALDSISKYFHPSMGVWIAADPKTPGYISPEDQLGLTIGKEPFEEVLPEYGIDHLKKVKFALGLTYKFSAIPMGTAGYTKNNAYANVDQQASQQQAQAIQYADQQIQQQVPPAVLAAYTANIIQNLKANDPQWSQLSASQQQQLINQQLQAEASQIAQTTQSEITSYTNSANSQIKSAVAAAVQQEKSEIDGRIGNYVRDNLTQQMFIFTGFDTGSGLISIRAGKFVPETGSSVDSNGKTDQEKLLIRNSTAQRLDSTASTGAVDLGVVKNFGNGVQAHIDAMVFHYRLPDVNQSSYTGNLLAMSTKSYSQEKPGQLYHLDAAAFRAEVDSKHLNVYGVVGQEKGQTIYSGGGKLMVGKSTTDGSYVEGPGFGNYANDGAAGRSSAASFTESYGLFNGKLTPYVGVDHLKGAMSADISNNANYLVDENNRYAGLHYRLMGNKPDSGFHLDLGASYMKTASDDIGAENKGSRIGFSIEITREHKPVAR